MPFKVEIQPLNNPNHNEKISQVIDDLKEDLLNGQHNAETVSEIFLTYSLMVGGLIPEMAIRLFTETLNMIYDLGVQDGKSEKMIDGL